MNSPSTTVEFDPDTMGSAQPLADVWGVSVHEAEKRAVK